MEPAFLLYEGRKPSATSLTFLVACALAQLYYPSKPEGLRLAASDIRNESSAVGCIDLTEIAIQRSC